MKMLRDIWIGLFMGVCLSYLLHLALNYYNQNSEIKDSSYASLMDNLNRYPDDIVFFEEVANALLDKIIIGSEHKAILTYLMDKHGIYTGAKIDVDHSNAKRELILIFNKLQQN